jgi:hypothetical protein
MLCCLVIGDRFAGADSREDAASLFDGDLMQQCRRQLIEQVRVVDADNGVLLCDKGFASSGE